MLVRYNLKKSIQYRNCNDPLNQKFDGFRIGLNPSILTGSTMATSALMMMTVEDDHDDDDDVRHPHLCLRAKGRMVSRLVCHFA